MGRAPCCDKANVKRGPWSPEEDAALKAYIEENGTGGNWIALPQKIGLKRCGKSCRLRWLNYLRPNIKHGGFSEEEDQLICSLYISIGSRWSIIAAQLPGRTDNDIKNYWNTKLKKKLLGPRKDPSHQSRRSLSLNNQELVNSKPDGSDHNGVPSQTLSSTALERMQLHLQLQGLHNPFSNFYSNPALWPKLHHLGAATTCLFQQGQLVANPMHQLASNDQTNLSALGSTQQSETNFPPTLNNSSMQEGFYENLNLDSMADGLQAELHNLLYGDTNVFDVEKSSSSSWDSASEYVLGYEL